MYCTGKTLKGIRGVQLDNQKALLVPGPLAKIFLAFLSNEKIKIAIKFNYILCHAFKFSAYIITNL